MSRKISTVETFSMDSRVAEPVTPRKNNFWIKDIIYVICALTIAVGVILLNISGKTRNESDTAIMVKEVNAAIERIRLDMDDVMSRLSEQESDNAQHENITQLKEENENLKKTLEDQTMEVKDFKNKLILLENTTSAMERSFQNLSFFVDAGCAFTAMISNTNSYIAGQTLIFDHVVTNEENGYNASTGEFTAPRTGLYVVTITVQVWQAYAYVDLIKGSEVIGRVHVKDYDSPYQKDTSSVTVTTRLDQGNIVFVRYINGETKSGYSFDYTWYCIFSGFLVS